MMALFCESCLAVVLTVTELSAHVKWVPSRIVREAILVLSNDEVLSTSLANPRKTKETQFLKYKD